MPASVLQGSIFHQAGRVSRAPEDKGGDWRSPAHAAPSAPFALSPHWGGGEPYPQPEQGRLPRDPGLPAPPGCPACWRGAWAASLPPPAPS